MIAHYADPSTFDNDLQLKEKWQVSSISGVRPLSYTQRARTAKCGNCDHVVLFHSVGDVRYAKSLVCTKCKATNILEEPDRWPNVPPFLYIGHNRNTRLKVYATPPETPDESWVHPWSIRSVLAQASSAYRTCYLETSTRGTVFGEPVFQDCCRIEISPDEWELTACHILSGWTAGQRECPLWRDLSALCQTETESRFLYQYLGYAKDRHFPMLVPQPWMGIAERRRPDFVSFVPLQHWKYRWLAIQLDGAHPTNAPDDDVRDTVISSHGYDVIRLRPNEKGYLEEVRRLVERIEEWMSLVSDDPWKVAVEARVNSTTPPPLPDEDLPF